MRHVVNLLIWLVLIVLIVLLLIQLNIHGMI